MNTHLDADMDEYWNTIGDEGNEEKGEQANGDADPTQQGHVQIPK